MVPAPKPPNDRLLDPQPGPMLVFDPATLEVVDANAEARRLYGYDADEFRTLGIDELRPAGDAPALRRILEGVPEQQPVLHAGVRHRHRDGTEFYVDVEAHPLRIGDRSLRVAFISESGAGAAGSEAVARQALLFRGTRDAVIFTDAEGTVTDWNPAAEALWGYARHEVLGRSASFLLGPRDAGAAAETLAAVEEEGRWEGLRRTVARDGGERWCEVRVLPIHDLEGNVTGTVGINRDVTRQRRLERELAETADSLRVLGDQLPHILWLADPDGRIRYLNERWEEYSGVRAEAPPGEVNEVLHPADAERTRDRWATSLATGRELLVEHRLRSADGEYRWHLTRGTPIRDERGRIARWVGSSLDIHAQKTAEESVRQREEYFRGVFEHAHDAIVLFDETSGQVFDVNPQAEQLYGYDRATFQELSLSDLYRDREDRRGVLADVAERGFASRVVPQLTRGGEVRHVEVNAALMQHRDRRVLLTINRDLTERRELEQQLQQAQKMEAVGRLAGGLAHDFNNLTTAIQGFASLLGERLEGDGEARDALDEIDRAATRATDLTRQLLAYTRQQVMRGRVLDLNAVVVSSGQLLARLIGEDIEIVTRLHPELGAVRADPGQLNQVLMNLAVNARDAMAGGGRLVLETADVTLDRAFADEHPPTEPGDYVRLRVADTGHGMSPDTLAHAFDPFFTTKAVGEGTGLGLATVYGIVKQSGGYIWIDSEEGRGTVFDIFLPRVDEPREGEERRPTEPEEASRPCREGPRTVLLVEDEAGVRKLARKVLERDGFEVIETANGAEALAVVEETEARIDLILTDMVMPRMSGKELARELALTRPHARVLFMSGYTGESLAERGDLTRTDVVLEKPFRPAELVQAVRQCLRNDEE